MRLLNIALGTCLAFGAAASAQADSLIGVSQAKCVDAAAEFATQHLNRHSRMCNDWRIERGLDGICSSISSYSTGYSYRLYERVLVDFGDSKELVQFVAYLPGDDDPSVLQVKMRYNPYESTCTLLDLDEEDELED